MLAFADSLFSVIAHCNCTFTLCPDANRILSRIIPASPNCWQSPRLVLHCFIPNWPLASAAALVLFEHASAVASFCATPLDLHPSPFSQSTHPTLCQTPRVYSTLVTFNLSPLPTHPYQAPRFNASTSTSSAMPPCSVAVTNPLRASILIPLHPSAFTGHTPPFHCHARCGGEPEMNLNGILHENSASKTTYTLFFKTYQPTARRHFKRAWPIFFFLSYCNQCHPM